MESGAQPRDPDIRKNVRTVQFQNAHNSILVLNAHHTNVNDKRAGAPLSTTSKQALFFFIIILITFLTKTLLGLRI